MARYRTQGRVRRQIQELFKGDVGGIAGLLSAEQVRHAVEAQGLRFRDCLFTPWITLWTFLAQVLSPDGSCREAVARLALMDVLLKAISRHRVGDRPDRYEPRAVKRRAKPVALLTVPREQARKRLAKSGKTKC